MVIGPGPRGGTLMSSAVSGRAGRGVSDSVGVDVGGASEIVSVGTGGGGPDAVDWLVLDDPGDIFRNVSKALDGTYLWELLMTCWHPSRVEGPAAIQERSE